MLQHFSKTLPKTELVAMPERARVNLDEDLGTKGTQISGCHGLAVGSTGVIFGM